ncbi:pentapeptide repeat-containing protein [Streptomyces sp. NPDC001296]
MTDAIEGSSFERLRQYGSGRVFSDLDLRRVKFTSSLLAQHDDPSFDLVVRDSILQNCSFSACTMAGVRLENVTVDGARLSKSSISGCVFRNVTLRGKIGQFIFAGPVRSLGAEMFAAFSDGMADFYRDVDWALDIRDAVFADATIRAVPGELVRRDENRHFLLRRADRDAVLSLPDAPDLAKAYFRDFDLTPFDSMVAVASQGSKTFEKQLAELQWLRERSLAG